MAGRVAADGNAAHEPSSRRDEIPLWLAAVGAIGAHSFVVPGVSVADVALALAASLAVGGLWASRRVPKLPRWLLWVAVAALWSLLGAAVLAAGSPFGFFWLEFGKSFAKLLFYPAAVFLVGTSLERLPPGRAADVLLWALTLNAAIALYIYLVMAAGLDLPYRFLWTLSEHGEETARFGFGVSLMPPVRARGLASEPSALGYFQVMGLAAALLLARSARRALLWRAALVVASVVLTFSLTSYGLLFVLGIVLLAQGGKQSLTILRRAAIPVALAVTCVLLLPAARQTFDSTVVTRLAEIVAGERDVSATLRLRSSWEMAAAMVRASPLFGAGLGHYDVALETLRPSLSMPEHLKPGTQGWNALAHLLGTLGPVGLGCGLLLLLEVWRRSRPAGVMMAAAAFADSTILGAPFWLFYLLLHRAASHHSAANSSSAAATTGQANDERA